jgi:hypothetical protein
MEHRYTYNQNRSTKASPRYFSPLANTPKVISTIHDSIKLARMVLRLNTG